ncbi:MAG TPA: hypothetical protein VER17_08895 [Tepidisphaeraceae bacterium]|nr:hypothetical protein [Tepidisphaeraceae bacterium]
MTSGFPRHPPNVRVYAGQPARLDASKFTVRYQVWGQFDTLDGQLRDDDSVTLVPRKRPDPPR